MITDRTRQDVARWQMLHDKGFAAMTAEEQAEWLGEMKGRYTHTDMNRVEAAVADLSARFVEEGYLLSPLSTKTNWNRWSCPTRDDMIRYLENVATLRSLITVYPSTPQAPTINRKLNYAMANDIEQILVDLDDVMTKLPQSRFYCGDIFAGEV